MSQENIFTTQMAAHGYKRTNFEEDEYASNGGTPTSVDFAVSNVAYRGSLSLPSWRKRTAQEKVLLVLVGTLTLVIVIMAGVLAYKDATVHQLVEDSQKYCSTPECINVASNLLTAMDRTVDPCEDFYQYSCGGWIKNNPIPSGHPRWGMFELIGQKNMLIMKNSIDKPYADFKSTAALKAKKFYDSCMDKDKLIEKAGGKPLLELIHKLNWHTHISDWNDNWTVPSDWNLGRMIEDLHLIGSGVFFSIFVAQDDKNSDVNILQIDQGGLGLPERNYYLNKTIDEDKVLSAYLKYMVKVYKLLGAPNDTYSEMRMSEVIQFETELANITTPAEDRRDEEKIYHKYKLRDLIKMYPKIDWLHLINHLLNVVGQRVTPKEDIIVYAPEFLKSLNGIITTYLSTDEGKRTLTNYMMWHVIEEFAAMLSKPFRDAKKEFTEAIYGQTGSDEKWHECISETNGVAGFAMGALFVKETFKGSSKVKAEEMIENVKTAFKSNLPNLVWMDDDTRHAAIDKANAVVDMIGYPEYIMDNKKLDKKYENMAINESDYFGNNLATLNYSIRKRLEKLSRPARKDEWDMTPTEVNAYYAPNTNSIALPAGVLQAPFFDKSYPKSLNYGAMGVVMGHELTHGFDDQGREFDKKGNLKSWWKKKAVDRFKHATECMVDQYSSYSLNNEKIRGKQTLGENIADNGGLKAAFKAYRGWVERNGAEKLLPGLDLSHDQLFFLRFGQVWCLNSQPEADHLQMLTDSHSPAKFRVIGPLSNSKEFAEAYKCSKMARMNPSKKCEVW